MPQMRTIVSLPSVFNDKPQSDAAFRGPDCGIITIGDQQS